MWNRTFDKLEADEKLSSDKRLKNLGEFKNHPVDLIAEVAHPSITEEYGESFLSHANYFVGSPTAFANQEVEKTLREKAENNSQGRGLYVPCGALWGVHDLWKMNRAGSLKQLVITMKKHPLSLKLEGKLGERLKKAIQNDEEGEVELFSGSVRDLCPLAPNNVNTMAVAALVASSLGFDAVTGRLVSDKSLRAHVIDVEAYGTKNSHGDQFSVKTTRYNPAPPGAVTGSATYVSFWNSLLEAATSRSRWVGEGEQRRKVFDSWGTGVHFC